MVALCDVVRSGLSVRVVLVQEILDLLPSFVVTIASSIHIMERETGNRQSCGHTHLHSRSLPAHLPLPSSFRGHRESQPDRPLLPVRCTTTVRQLGQANSGHP